MFAWKLTPLYLFAIIATSLLVFTGMDWLYLVFVVQNVPSVFLVSANLLGFILPTLIVGGLLVAGWLTKNKLFTLFNTAMIYAVLLGFTISTVLKVFTGRTSPPHTHRGVAQPMIDNSHAFNFGFMNEQILGGWPSSHTTVAFACAVTFVYLLPARWYIRVCLFLIATYIGIGVSFGYHWLSEFVAGAALGIAIGVVVGSHFIKKLESTKA